MICSLHSRLRLSFRMIEVFIFDLFILYRIFYIIYTGILRRKLSNDNFTDADKQIITTSKSNVSEAPTANGKSPLVSNGKSPQGISGNIHLVSTCRFL